MTYQHSCNWTSWNNGVRMCGICGFKQFKDGAHIENDEARAKYVEWIKNQEKKT